MLNPRYEYVYRTDHEPQTQPRDTPSPLPFTEQREAVSVSSTLGWEPKLYHQCYFLSFPSKMLNPIVPLFNLAANRKFTPNKLQCVLQIELSTAAKILNGRGKASTYSKQFAMYSLHNDYSVSDFGADFGRKREVYYKQRDKFEEDHRDGFQTVGDIAYRDDEGFLYICDRKKDMIISGGMNIYPAEIEAALEAHPDIYEAAVFGIPSDDWGEIVHAVVVRRDGADLDEAGVKEFARAHLASYKIPRSISWLDELPKTGSGKILKRELRQPFWAGRTSNV